jgi:hypothetical protein
LPLGILAGEFAKVEQFFYGSHDCQLFVCSDGAVDTVAPEADMLRGMQVLLGAAQHDNADERLQQILQVLDKKLQGGAALDDIALMMVKCPGEHQHTADTLLSKTPKACCRHAATVRGA